jgi:dihydroorotate dehydrogenase
MYSRIRKLLFLLDAEKAHYFSMWCFRLLSFTPFRIFFSLTTAKNKRLKRSLFGLSFRNPVGLGAGFDKNASWLRELNLLGFGFVEIGTVTPKPQSGNDKPRLFRLPKDQALINRMGFNNKGAEVVAANLKRYQSHSAHMDNRMIIGGNIGKNKDTPNEDAWRDYLTCFDILHPYVDYFVVNISSPNTPGLRNLQQTDSIRKILLPLYESNKSKAATKPIFVKIAPDLSDKELHDIAALAMEMNWSGIIISNTTLSREGLRTAPETIKNIGAGGLSGKPLRKRSTEMLRQFQICTGGKIPIIASGGIFDGEDAKEKFEAGASLIQVWTGFIYEGPLIVKNICKSLS